MNTLTRVFFSRQNRIVSRINLPRDIVKPKPFRPEKACAEYFKGTNHEKFIQVGLFYAFHTVRHVKAFS